MVKVTQKNLVRREKSSYDFAQKSLVWREKYLRVFREKSSLERKIPFVKTNL